MIRMRRILVAAAAASVAWGAGRAAAPVIEHTPISVAVRGQPLIVRARVQDTQRAVRSVMLYYSTSRDAAPFEVKMEATGPEAYLGTIPDNVLAALSQLTYYIAAENDQGATTETKWFNVKIESPRGGAPAAAGGERPKWVVPALVAGGVALAAGGALIAANSGDDGGGGGGGTPSPDVEGTYTGTSTIYTESGASSSITNSSFRLTISSSGGVSAKDLRPGSSLSGQMSGSNFVLTEPVQEGDLSGEIQYVGTVVDGRVVGQIQGSAGSASASVRYTGTFSGVRQ